MNVIARLLTALILAAWIGMIAVFSIQNITDVSLKFLAFESIRLPVGVLLAFSVGSGMVLGAIAPLFWQRSARGQRRRAIATDDLDEFNFDL
jgi:uncharacterized integral membrane protein